jgi:hypothetical protein
MRQFAGKSAESAPPFIKTRLLSRSAYIKDNKDATGAR